MPQPGSSLFAYGIRMFYQNLNKNTSTYKGNGLVQLIRVGNSIRLKWVIKVSTYILLLTAKVTRDGSHTKAQKCPLIHTASPETFTKRIHTQSKTMC